MAQITLYLCYSFPPLFILSLLMTRQQLTMNLNLKDPINLSVLLKVFLGFKLKWGRFTLGRSRLSSCRWSSLTGSGSQATDCSFSWCYRSKWESQQEERWVGSYSSWLITWNIETLSRTASIILCFSLSEQKFKRLTCLFFYQIFLLSVTPRLLFQRLHRTHRWCLPPSL